jgi:hypothetical protein
MSTMSGTRVEAKVRKDTEAWIEPVGRIGLATQGVLYAVVGLLALQVAAGHNDQADQRGAIAAISDQPFGRFLLLVLTIGLALHCCWRLVLAARGTPGDDGAKQWAKRLAELGRGVLYGAFTVVAAKLLVGSSDSGDGGGGGSEQRQAVGTVLDWPGGEFLVTAVGIAVIGTGVWHASKAVTRKFVDNLDLSGRSETTRKVIVVLGSIGYLARGLVFGMVGWFLIEAAVDDDPNHTGGLDKALKRLAISDHGAALLRLVAAGLILFGIYRIIDAWLRKREEVTNP